MATSLLHVYRLAKLHDNVALHKQASALGFKVLASEVCFNIESSAALTPEEEKSLGYLLQETYEPEKCQNQSLIGACSDGESILEVGPRQQFTSAWSTNAVSICAAIGLSKVTRVEKSRRYRVQQAVQTPAAAFHQLALLVHDRMTECVYPDGIQSFASHKEPEGWKTVPVLAEGAKALEKMSKEQGLGYDQQDIEYYVRVFRDELKRDPTTVECFDLAQGNSEHSRHWFFGGKMEIDGEVMPNTLFQLVKRPYKVRPANSVIGFHDNSSALRGFQHTALQPARSTKNAAVPCALQEVERDYDLTCTVETHNFPCGIAPFAGAETGAGGRMRDGSSTGKGSLIVAGVAGYAVGNLHIPGYELPWETKDFSYPENMAKPLQILIDSSNGASDYGNKFGEPLLCGWTRSFGHRMPASGERFEWVKPIMLSGGVGQMDHLHVAKEEPTAGQLIVKLGGPAYRIGVGGGAASSMAAGDNAAELDFNAVQRGDAEMQQKVNRVIRACVELGADNPILSIHDQGAGGPGNVLKEIMEPAGGVIDIRSLLVGDPSMSVLELWTAEFQENHALLINAESKQLFDDICKRERTSYSICGHITGDGNVVVKDTRDNSTPVDLPLEKVLGKMPQKTFKSKRIAVPVSELTLPASFTVEAALMNGVLRLVSVGSKRFLTNKVDRSVTGLIAQQQCVGPLHTPLANFAAFAQSPLGFSGAATAIGEQPLKGLAGDAAGCQAMARLAVAEALTNLMWIKISSLDSVKASGNWMWAAKLEGEGPKMYDTASALSDILVELGVAIDGGKDSLSMAARVPLADGRSETAKSPGQLVMTMYAPVPDVRIKVTPDLKSQGDSVLLFVDLGAGCATLGGSALAQVVGQTGAGASPQVDVPALKAAFTATQRLLTGGLLLAGHDRSDGGLLVTVLEMAFAGRTGFDMKLDAPVDGGPHELFAMLFGEAPGIVYEVRKSDLGAVRRLLESEGVRAIEIASTRADMKVSVTVGSEAVVDADVRTLHDAWEATSFQLERLQCALPCVEEEEAGLKERRAPPFKISFVPEPTAPALLRNSQKHRVAIVRQEGSNGDREMAASFHLAGFEVWDVHMSDLLEGRIRLDIFRGAAFVGGFSYADTLDSAKGWAGSVLKCPALAAQFEAFRDRSDTFSLGICNGCQLLALLGWVPGSEQGGVLPLKQQPRFIHNKSGRFESRFVTVSIEKSAASQVWLRGMEGSQLGVWVAHGEGRCHFPDPAVYDHVKRQSLVPMRYLADDGNQTQKYPFNPNGSPDGIVGLCSTDGRHMAIMPHPERVTIWPWQWPYAPQSWMEGPSRLVASPWLRMFQNARTWCGAVNDDA
jgi:phosphoribosylformylglycinamidine synthase